MLNISHLPTNISSAPFIQKEQNSLYTFMYTFVLLNLLHQCAANHTGIVNIWNLYKLEIVKESENHLKSAQAKFYNRPGQRDEKRIFEQL